MNKKIFIAYADDKFKKQKEFALKMAKSRGKFDEIIGYSRSDIDAEFYEENKHILDQKRGGGYWLWKPYFIVKTLETMNNGDYLFYSDAGAFFLQSVDVLINELEKYNQDIMGFELPLIEKQWTKRELFINMDCDKEQYSESNQIFASYMLIRKTEFSVNFFNQYLQYGCNELNITDKYDSSVVQDNDFIEHRHDQSIFSLLYKKYNLKPFKEPTQYGLYPYAYGGIKEEFVFEPNKLYVLKNRRMFRLKEYKEKYNLVLYSNRKGHPILSFIKYYIKIVLSSIGFYKGLIS